MTIMQQHIILYTSTNDIVKQNQQPPIQLLMQRYLMILELHVYKP